MIQEKQERQERLAMLIENMSKEEFDLFLILATEEIEKRGRRAED